MKDMLKFPSVWPVARYRFVFEITSEMALPDYAGSAIRGAFGHSLRRIACMTHRPTCPDCPLYRSCPYAMIFESPAPDSHQLQKFSRIPNPYVIEAPTFGRRALQAGDELQFHVVLFGRALHQLALVVYALQKAFERNVAQGTARLKEVFLVEEATETLVYAASSGKIESHRQSVEIIPVDQPRDVELTFRTHLRLQNNGKAYGPKDINATAFFSALIRRASLLREFHADPFPFDFHALKASSENISSTKQLVWHNWKRYSVRQQQGMYLGGVSGSWFFEKVPPELLGFLLIGQLLHVGKNATFGLGGYYTKLI